MERVGLAVNTLESKDELYVFGGSFNFGSGLKYSNQILKINMKDIIMIGKEDDEQPLFKPLIPFRDMALPRGEIRMFDKIGSKCMLMLVDHAFNNNDHDQSELHLVEVDFDDELPMIRKFKIHDNSNYEHLNTDFINRIHKDDVDI